MREYKKRLLLGKGATAWVYLVEEAVSGKRFAMKVSENRELLQREAEIMRDLKSKYFPEFVEYIPQEGALVMEYVEGQDLQTVLNREAKLEPGEIVYIVEEILQALSVLHEHTPAMIYRDIKPANIMLGSGGEIRLIDLGAVCLEAGEDEREGAGAVFEATRKEGKKMTVTRAGTYGYGAPEQFWEGARCDRSCDIYSVGKVLAYLLTGRNPAEPPYEAAHLLQGLGGKAVVYQSVLERSLALSPQARFSTAVEMRRALQEAYEFSLKKNKFVRRQKSVRIYEKCIWKSEYRRIF